MTRYRYEVEHWTSGAALADYKNRPAIEITVNDRAATRQGIVRRIREHGVEFVERSDWAAPKNRAEKMRSDWNFHSIAIHHAGRSQACGPAALQLQDIQRAQMGTKHMDDIAYHYAVDCLGVVYEARDVRFKGEHLADFNTGVIGIVMLEDLTEANEGGDLVARARSVLSAIGVARRARVPDEQRSAAATLINVLREFFAISKLGGHREFPRQTREGKICPGRVGLELVRDLRATLGLSKP